MHDSDGAFVGSPSLFRGLRSWGKWIKKSCAKAALGLGKDRVVEPVDIVFNASLMILVIPDWSNYCDSLLQHLHCKSIIIAVTHRVEHVDLSTHIQEVGGLRYLKQCSQAPPSLCYFTLHARLFHWSALTESLAQVKAVLQIDELK